MSKTKPKPEWQAVGGGDAENFQKICVLAPLVNRRILEGLRIDTLTKGPLYSVGDNGIFTLVVTGLGQALLGDAVLYLEKTPCEDLILFGACGARVGKGFSLGDVVVVKKALAQESFTNMLQKKPYETVLYPEEKILSTFLSLGRDHGLKKATCLTVGSLKLEEEYLAAMADPSIDLVDMETSAFYAASAMVKKRALAFLFVSDLISQFPYYQVLAKENQSTFRQQAFKAGRILYELLQRI